MWTQTDLSWVLMQSINVCEICVAVFRKQTTALKVFPSPNSSNRLSPWNCIQVLLRVLLGAAVHTKQLWLHNSPCICPFMCEEGNFKCLIALVSVFLFFMRESKSDYAWDEMPIWPFSNGARCLKLTSIRYISQVVGSSLSWHLADSHSWDATALCMKGERSQARYTVLDV